MSDIISLMEDKLPMQLDSVSWNKRHDLLALGAYMIDPSDSTKRVGKIFLIQLQLENSEQGDNEKANQFALIQETDLSGVLDLRWEPDCHEKLAVATSDSMDLYQLDSNQNKLKLLNRIQLTAMALYTQWMDPDKLLYSDSEGFINIMKIDPFEIEASQKVHDNLTWVVQCFPKNGLIFSGSDEGKFTGFLLENMRDEEKHFIKKFEVGVTSILFLKDNLLAVGGYDDTLRLFTIDCVDPIMLSLKKKIEFGGAVWRTIAFPISTSNQNNEVENFHLVAACARNGIHVIDLNTKTWVYNTIAKCLEYEGFLAYGLDVKPYYYESSMSYVIASCYFDNNQFHVWKIDIPKH